MKVPLTVVLLLSAPFLWVLQRECRSTYPSTDWFGLLVSLQLLILFVCVVAHFDYDHGEYQFPWFWIHIPSAVYRIVTIDMIGILLLIASYGYGVGPVMEIVLGFALCVYVTLQIHGQMHRCALMTLLATGLVVRFIQNTIWRKIP